MLLASRGDIEWVMAQVGHADSDTTMRVYSQLLKRQKRDGYGAAFDAMVDEARELVLASDHGGERALRDVRESTDSKSMGPRMGPRGEIALLTEQH